MSYFADKDFFDDEATMARGQQMAEGNLCLDWFATENEQVVCKPADSRRGLTYADCNVGSYGYDALPELVRHNYSMAARGAALVPGLPDLGYTLNRKSEVWSDDVPALYEEAKTRRWTPAVAVDWERLAENPLPPDLAAAMSQLCTSVMEISLAIMEFPSKWVCLINQEFLELKSYLCAQMIDEARHVEVFRKRALAAGGLKRASVAIEQALKEILSADTYVQGSVAINVMVNSLLLTIFATAARASDVDARLFRLCAQDTAREIAYGLGNIRYYLYYNSAKAALLHEYLDETEHTFAGIAAATELVEPLIVIAGGGTSPEAIDVGRRKVRRMLARTVDEYLERLAAAGLERSNRSRLPGFFTAQ